MEKSGKRGKIPQQDWPSIIKRYEAGETLASIARTYDCSPPAISYILSRSRARDMEHTTIELAEPQLVKAQAEEITAVPREKQSAPELEKAAAPVAKAPTSDGEVDREASPAEPKHYSNGEVGALDIRNKMSVHEAGAPGRRGDEVQDHAAPTSEDAPVTLGVADLPLRSEPRRTLHLSLSPNSAQNSEAARHRVASVTMTERSPARTEGANQELFRLRSTDNGSAGNHELTGAVAEPSRANEGATFIDQALRDRVDGDISAFLAAFDAALAHDTVESRAGLRQATDRLLRAGARTRIELERLEARVPLAARDHPGFAAPSWRPR
jgi:hypothetical protein